MRRADNGSYAINQSTRGAWQEATVVPEVVAQQPTRGGEVLAVSGKRQWQDKRQRMRGILCTITSFIDIFQSKLRFF